MLLCDFTHVLYLLICTTIQKFGVGSILNSFSINKALADFCLNKLLICSLFIVSNVVVKLRYWVGCGMWNMIMQIMCFKH